MRRREVLLLIGVAGISSLAARAQQSRLPLIGYLSPGAPSAQNRAALRDGLAVGGFVEGRDVTIEVRSADGHYDRLPELAAELIDLKPSAIIVTTPTATLAAKKATTSIPIVFSMGGDPVAAGLVTSLNHPSGNVTGVTFLSNQLDAKRLQMMHRLLPHANAVAAIANPGNPNTAAEVLATEDAARSLGLKLFVSRAGTEDEITNALEEVALRGVTAIHVMADQFLTSKSERINALAIGHGIATSFSNVAALAGGGLMAYGADVIETERQAAVYVARILKGEKPGDMPVIQSSKFAFVLNLKTAKILGLDLDPNLVRLADQVIE